ncbi:hypothetical protein ABXS69_08410 [Actinomyces timonensis]|uniref:Antitoxin VbhA domain-containing protein n=1 Tax=Actinomyces timonensis TaxID=1288391 RepID=A0AAU8N3M5_9ACTO
MTQVPVAPTHLSAEAMRARMLARAAANLAGHAVEDEDSLELLDRVASGQVSGDEAVALFRRRALAR